MHKFIQLHIPPKNLTFRGKFLHYNLVINPTLAAKVLVSTTCTENSKTREQIPFSSLSIPTLSNTIMMKACSMRWKTALQNDHAKCGKGC